MENGVSPVSCPVCTLYMREGVTLQSHLDTHPKDQVIAALVRISARDSTGTKDNQSDSEASPIATSEVACSSQGSISSSQCFSPSSSHFTTAITYQQFLSSNSSASNSVMPQYVSMPTVLSAPNATQSAAFMQMLYNPYMVQQQQQQFQLLSSVTSPSHQQPFMSHVAPSYPVHHVPQPQVNLASTSVPLSVSYQPSDFPPDCAPQGFQNTTSNVISSSLSLPVSSSSSFSPSTLSCPVSSAGYLYPSVREQTANYNEQGIINKPRSPPSDQHRNISIPNGVAPCSKQQLEEGTVIADVHEEDSFPGRNLPSSTCDAGAAHSGVATQTSDPQYEGEDQKSPCVAKDEQAAVTLEDAASDLQQELPRNEPVNVRVRKDLNDVAVSPMVQARDSGSEDTTENEYMDVRNEDMSQISGIIRNALRIQPPPVSVEDSDEYITSDRQFSGLGDTSKEESAVKEMTEGVEDNCEKPEETNEGSANRFLDLDSSEPVNIIEIDGIQILVPSQFLENPSSMLGGKLPADDSPASVPLGVSIPTEGENRPREIESEAAPVPSLNIQTDEMMPPRGELSEQESVGGSDSSVWVQAFREKEVSTSYDLLARESWEASDGSDADVILESEVTASVVEKHDRSGTSSQEKRKTRAKRVYKCGTCGEPFNCPKERRVHGSTYHSDNSGSSERVASANEGKITMDIVSRKQAHKRKARVKKMIEEEEDKSCVKTEEPQFMKVFLEEDTETKMEAEDGAEEGEELAENASATSVKAEAAEVPKQDSVLESAAIYHCSMCTEVFTSVKLRSGHEHKVHKKTKDKKNMCATCKEVFTNDSEYQAHLQAHPLECSQCGKYFYRRQNLELHLKRHLGIKPHKCTVCDKAFVTKQKLVEHTNSHTGNAPIKCPLCDETFRRYSNLIQHKHRHHMNIKKKVKDFICHCGEIFHSKKKLEWHKEIHEEKPKCCTYCSERFVHAASLTRHVRKAHDCRYVPKCGREVENVECKVCGYVFLKSSIPVHMRMHSGERPYSCHVCGKNFTTKWNLQLHRWTHAARSSKPFKCSLCKSAFFRRNDYTAHMHSHRNVRPYTCNHCGCQFIRKYNCLRHVREHEVGKSFSCNVCGKLFHRSYYLKEHLRVHSGSRPFACHICGKASSTKSNHNKHVKIHHAREPVNTEG